MKEYCDWDEGCYEKVTHSNELERNSHEVQHLCNIAREKNEESKKIPQDVLEKAIEFIYGLIKEKETNGIELYEPDEKGWRYGAKKSRCSEKIEDELVRQKHGHWIPIKLPTGVGEFGYKEHMVQEVTCSECKFIEDVSASAYLYCPNCGAKMDEEVKQDAVY